MVINLCVNFDTCSLSYRLCGAQPFCEYDILRIIMEIPAYLHTVVASYIDLNARCDVGLAGFVS
jgi:hypothetical protein